MYAPSLSMNHLLNILLKFNEYMIFDVRLLSLIDFFFHAGIT